MVDKKVIGRFLGTLLNLRQEWVLEEIAESVAAFRLAVDGWGVDLGLTLTYYGVVTLSLPARDSIEKTIMESRVFEKALESRLKNWFGVEPDIKVGSKGVAVSLPLEAVRRFSPGSGGTDWALEIAEFVYGLTDRIKERLIEEVSKELVDAIGILDDL